MFNQKILCIGAPTIGTDHWARDQAKKNSTVNHGLIHDPNFIPTEPGYYHTSVVDMVQGDIVKFSVHFDEIQLVDQPKEQYDHYKTVISTFQTFLVLEEKGINVIYKDVPVIQRLLYWKKFLKDNKSFCFHPFMAVVDNTGDYTSICPKNWVPVQRLTEIKDWKTDPEYMKIRKRMVNGEKLRRCWDCYQAEDNGYESTRQFETLEWAEKMEIDSPQDFLNVEKPVFFEIRPSNKCSGMCRYCSPNFSHLLKNEFQKIELKVKNEIDREWDTLISGNDINSIDFSHAKRIYFAGGEPTVMPEFYGFLEKCISEGNTEFELTVGTNGMHFSEKLLDLLDHFPNACFSMSFDGYKKINDYIRWKTEFDTMTYNARRLRERGHVVGLQTVISIWNITKLHLLFEYYDREHPQSSLLVQPAESGEKKPIFYPYNHPLPEMVAESMQKCQQTNVYYSNGRSVKSMIDSLYNHYSNPDYKCDVPLLRGFYEFNDKLDFSRGVKLADYIPELAKARDIYGV